MFSEEGAAPFVVNRAPRERRRLFGLRSKRLLRHLDRERAVSEIETGGVHRYAIRGR
jgi:hypothetical protein